MDVLQFVCTIFVTVVAYAGWTDADHEYMVSNAESRTVPFTYETRLQCLMNIEPDKFQWKFYPLPAKDAFNPKAPVDLSKTNFILIPTQNYTMQRKESELSLLANSKEISGDYQCLAYYGASVVASVPWRITLARLGQFPPQNNVEITVIQGNTVNWRCEQPESNPEAFIDYYKNNEYIRMNSTIQSDKLAPTKSLIITDVTTRHSGKYTCQASNVISIETRNSTATFTLRVIKSGPLQPPMFIIPPRKSYTVNKGDDVLLECSAVGNPIPQVVWEKKIGPIPKNRADMIEGGLIIRNVSSSDDGVYVCNQKNSRGTISHQITLIYNEPPSIDCFSNMTDVKQSENLDLDCLVTGTPEPQISWFLNGFSVSNDSAIEAIGNKIYFRPVEKRHAGNLQIFARNVVRTVYSSISIKVIPLSSSIDEWVLPARNHHRHNGNKASGSRKPPKHSKMVPPSKPIISRLNDEAVMVRWTVMNKGLPIQFFKVQYRELGPADQHDHHNRGKGSKWMTANADIPPHIRSYEVNNLKSDHWYRFRIAAVYSNNDNKNSPNSDKFHLRKLDFDNRNPLPVPLITHTETINSTTVKIYWKCDLTPNVTVEGFFINYNSASSAADYMKATVDGNMTNSYVLEHLQPDTVYDIKLQSFTSKSASEFSSILKARTLALASTSPPPVEETTANPSNPESAGLSKWYVVTAVGAVVGVGAIVCGIALLLFCRKWKQKKNSNRSDRDKPTVDDHHIQADGDEYIVSPKNQARANGCVPPNRITITANPLADADNKNQNMIEMSCLSSQNNNCASVQASASSEDGAATNSQKDKKVKSRDKRIRNKHNVEMNTSSGENYV